MALGVTKASGEFLAAIVRIANWFKSRRASDVTNLQALADRKFSELEVMHNEFVERVIMLQTHSRRALEKLNITDEFDSVLEELKHGIQEISDLRKQEHDLGRERYEEAKAFDAIRLDPVGIIKTTPEEVTTSIHAFLRTYGSYFENSGRYRHELDRAQSWIENKVDRLEVEKRSTGVSDKKSLEDVFRRAVEMAGQAEETSRDRWSEVARSYHLLNAVLLKHGFKRVSQEAKTPKMSPRRPTIGPRSRKK
jgi:hypothetical protein